MTKAVCDVCGHRREWHATKMPTWCLYKSMPDDAPWLSDCDCGEFLHQKEIHA